MKSKKRFLIVTIILILIFVLVGIIYTLANNQDNNSSIGRKLLNAKTDNKNNSNQIVIELKNNNENVKLTKQDINYLKILNPDSKNIEEETIMNKTLSIEAKKRNIVLSENEKKELESIVNSSEILKGINNENEKEEMKYVIYEYLEDIEYSSKLKNQILDEIKDYKLSIKDTELEQKVNKYKTLQEQANLVTKIEEKEELFKQIYLQLVEIQNLYYSKIQDQYLIK